MMTRAGIVAATVASACLSMSTLSTAAPVWSVGGAFGGGSYSNQRFNDSQPPGTESIKSGLEFGASLRCQLSPRWAVELEATHMHGSATTGNRLLNLPQTVHTEATAIPLNAILELAGTDRASLRVLAGGGILTGAHWRSTWSGVTETDQSSKSVTRPYGQAGLEAAWRPHDGFEVTGRVLGRLAQANHVLSADGSDNAIDHTGVAITLGARFGLSL